MLAIMLLTRARLLREELPDNGHHLAEAALEVRWSWQSSAFSCKIEMKKGLKNIYLIAFLGKWGVYRAVLAAKARQALTGVGVVSQFVDAIAAVLEVKMFFNRDST